jgi:hypothetical protein
MLSGHPISHMTGNHKFSSATRWNHTCLKSIMLVNWRQEEKAYNTLAEMWPVPKAQLILARTVA